MNLNLPIHQKYLDMIERSEKTIEVRLYSSKFMDIQPGHYIHFNGVVKKRITKIITHSSLDSLVKKESAKAMGFKNKEEAYRELKRIYWYDLTGKKVLAIYII